MDHRIALKAGTELRFGNDNRESIHCVIKAEIGRGGSCIVYEAARTTDTGDQSLYRVKECYPYKLSIARNNGTALIPQEKDKKAFCQRREQFRANFMRAHDLFYMDDNYSVMTNPLDVFDLNGTCYILYSYSSKKTLAPNQPKSLKECITLVQQVATALDTIHKQGYLYLDIKPDNILLVDGFPKRIELFDFDSLVKITDLLQAKKGTQGAEYLDIGDIRLSYSKGFTAYELQSGKVKRVGLHTDVYGIGALLFYLLLGRTPNSSDCEMYAEYDFSTMQYDLNQLDDKLFPSLQDFFHKTLAVYYPDRYQTMGEVLDELQKIEKCANPIVPRIFSTKMIKPGICYGREPEFEKLEEFRKSKDSNCLFVTGMGGIGKSTLMRVYLVEHRDQFDTVLYTYFRDNMATTISNDSDIDINTLKQWEEEVSDGRYFKRKIQKIKELVRGTSSILVIDNFSGVMDQYCRELLQTGLKVVLLTRTAPSFQGGDKLEVAAITDEDALRCIFERNLERSVTAQEQDYFQQILQRIGRHTLVLELIAKQIANSHITLASAAQLVDAHGFSSMAPEKVDYEKDHVESITKNTIGNILDALFEATALSQDKKVLLKVASLLGDDGMDINQFQHIMTLSSKDDINQLIEDSWLMISGDTLSMHRVIQEAMRRWAWTPQYLEAAEQFLTYFYVEIWLESTKNNYPKKLQVRLSVMKGESRPKVKKMMECIREKYFQRGLAGKAYRERYARVDDITPADMEKLTVLLQQSENILKQCKRESALQDSDVYASLVFVTVLKMPQYRDVYRIDEIDDILPTFKLNGISDDTHRIVDRSERMQPIQSMRFYNLFIRVYVYSQRFEDAERILAHAEQLAKKVRQHEAYALYYDTLVDYYDTRLNGAYDVQTPAEAQLLEQMLAAIENCMKYAKRNQKEDGDHLYINNLLAKATILMRSNGASPQEILKLIVTAEKAIEENTLPYADVHLQHALVCAWYSGLVVGSRGLVEACIQKAQELSDKITPTDFGKIEKIVVPCANIFYEMGCHQKALTMLDEGLLLCSEHSQSETYAHTKQEIWEHLWDVAVAGQEFELCQKVLHRIDAENEALTDPKNRIIISDEVRSILENKTK